MSNSGSKGKSGNTGGGTETSFVNTPQAKDDPFGTAGSGQLDYVSTTYVLDVMKNDLGGKAKSLWSVDDGVNDSGVMSGHEAGDLLTQDLAGVSGIAANRSQFGAALSVTADGRIAYDTSTIDAQYALDLTTLALGEVMTDSFIYAIRLASGTLSWARATVVLTGVNDTPVVHDVTLLAVEDGGAVTGAFNGDDIDSDDDGSSLVYTINGAPALGTLTNNGDGTFTYDPGANYQSLAEGDEAEIDLSYTATDSHSATSASGVLTITVTGVNDDPTLLAGALAATEDGAIVTLDLYALGDDVDSDDTGSSLIYTLESVPAGGSAAISGTVLSFNPGADFQSLAAGELQSFDLQVRATDNKGGSVTNTVTVTLTGVNDAPVIQSGSDGVGAIIGKAPVAPFTVEQYSGYRSTNLGELESYAANNAASITVTTNIIDYTDDPAGAVGEIPGSKPWPVAQANGVTGTGHSLNDNFFVRITGQINVTAADTYSFRTWNDDGVFLKVNNSLIINDPGIHPEVVRTGSIYLTPGTYPIELYFFEFGGEASLEFTYSNSSGTFGLVDLDPMLRDSGIVLFNDVDLTDAHTVTAAPDGSTLGTLTAAVVSDTTGSGVGGQVEWQYAVDNEAVRYLGAGDTKVESFTVTVNDGNGGTDTQQVDVTVTGINDVAVLGNAVANLIETDAQLSTGGTLSIADVDSGEAFFTAQSNTAGDFGNFSIDANGNWSFISAGALDHLVEGQIVTDVFNVTSVDGTATTVTVSVTGTADGPVAVNDTNTLTASSAPSSADKTVYWVDWTGLTFESAAPYRNGVYSVQGTITLPTGTIGVTYHGQLEGIQLSGGYDFYVTKNGGYGGPVTSTDGAGVFTSAEVANGPTNNDILQLNHTDSARTLTFSEPVANLFFAVVSMNKNGYLFDQDFKVVSSADSSSDSGYWGWADSYTKTNLGDGRYGISTPLTGNNEFHGVLAIENAVSSLTWTGQADEGWNGFTIGTYGKAQTATVSGNVLSNDDEGGPTATIEVSAAGGVNMVGNSVTLTLASGAILKVDRDGDYLYDDKGMFASLGDGDSHQEVVQYTVRDNDGYTDTATLTITVNGVNDGPLAVVDTATTNEDSAVTINVLANDTDVDAGDSKTLVSVSGAQNGSVSIVGNNVVYTPNANTNGNDSFTYVMQDAFGATSTAGVNVTVNPVNDAPAINAPINSVGLEDTMIGINGLSISDDDVGSNLMRMSLSVTNGSLITNPAASSVLTAIDSDGSDGTLEYVGSLDDLNSAIQGSVLYIPTANFYGSSTFTFVVSDQGGSGSGGAKSASASVAIEVLPVAEPPEISFNGLSIVNPSFEEANGSTPTGWTVLGAGIDRLVSPGGWQAGDGSYSIDLNALNAGGVKQTLATVAGTTYTIGFMMSKNPLHQGVRTLMVEADGTSDTYSFGSANTHADMKWQWKTFTFTAEDDSTELSFTSMNSSSITNGAANGPVLDGLVGLIAKSGLPTTISGLGVSESEASGNMMQLSLSVNHGTLNLGSLAGLTAVDGNGFDGTLSYIGQLDDINDALQSGVIYTSSMGSGVDTLSATIQDQGAVGTDAQMDTVLVDIRVIGSGPMVYVF